MILLLLIKCLFPLFKDWYVCLLTVLIDFSLTVKAATLIFISRCVSSISSAKEGKSGFIYKRSGPRKRACIS